MKPLDDLAFTRKMTLTLGVALFAATIAACRVVAPVASTTPDDDVTTAACMGRASCRIVQTMDHRRMRATANGVLRVPQETEIVEL